MQQNKNQTSYVEIANVNVYSITTSAFSLPIIYNHLHINLKIYIFFVNH